MYLSPTSCLDPDVALNKFVLPGDKLGLSGKSPFPPNSPKEPVLCTTGKYPKRECFLKYFFDLNLFLSSFVKSRMSSPEVVYDFKKILFITTSFALIALRQVKFILLLNKLLPQYNILAQGEPFYGFCTCHPFQQRNSSDTCQN